MTTQLNATSTYHPLSPVDQTAMQAIRKVIASHPAPQFVPAWRPAFDGIMGHTPSAEAVRYEAGQVGGIDGWWCHPRQAVAGTALLYLHGGAYVVGSAKAYRNFAGQIASRAQAPAFVADYALAPEHRFPAALNDAIAAYNGLVAAGFTRILVVGDSAGGGLALAVVQHATERARLEQGLRPSGALLLSPWTDLTLSGASLEPGAAADPFLSRALLNSGALTYAPEQDRRDPRLSPVFGNLAGLPPIFVHVGEDEVLLDDARALTQALSAAGSPVSLHIWQGMLHVFPSQLGQVQAAELALDSAAAFLREV